MSYVSRLSFATRTTLCSTAHFKPQYKSFELHGMCLPGSAGCRLLQDLEVSHVEVDACGDAQAAAEGAVLGLFQYDLLKTKKKTKVTTQLHGRYANQLLFLAKLIYFRKT